jgi:two-component system, NarL family, sensor histidine kinase BarA
MILDSPDKIKQEPSGKMQILYVEDDRNSQFLVEQILRDKYDIDIAPHARDVMTWVKLKNYDLILMDIKLDEGYSGIELTQEIRKLNQYKNVPIMAVTAMAFKEELNYFIEHGCTDFITKPIDFKVFKEKIENLLSQVERVNRSASYL